MLTGQHGGLHAGRHVQLAQDVLHMDLHRGFGDAQRARDLLVALAAGDAAQDVLLPRRQAGQRRCGCRRRGHRGGAVGGCVRAGRRATVNLDVLPGARARIGAITVVVEPLPGAPRRLGDATIRRLLGVHEGDLYRERELIDAQRTLYQSDLFRHVEVTLANDSTASPNDSLVTLVALVAENYLRQVDTEEGWAVLDCFKARVQLIDKNFLGA